MKEEKSQRASIIGQIAAAAAAHPRRERRQKDNRAAYLFSLDAHLRARALAAAEPPESDQTRKPNARIHWHLLCRLIPNFGISGTSRRVSHTFSCFPLAMQLF
jgi:hypothetical protein